MKYPFRYLVEVKNKKTGEWKLLKVSRTLNAADQWLFKNTTDDDIWKKKKEYRVIENRYENGGQICVYKLSANALHEAISKLKI